MKSRGNKQKRNNKASQKSDTQRLKHPLLGIYAREMKTYSHKITYI